MPNTHYIAVYKTAPILRLLLPLVVGIILQWYLQITLPLIIVTIICFCVAYACFNMLPLGLKFKLQALQGVLLNLIILSAGLFITYNKDVRISKNWYGNFYKDSSYLIVKINEPLVEKAKSFKADGVVEAIVNGNNNVATQGKLLLYFSKDSTTPQLHYGDKILIKKNLQQIKNSGNPGAFNYQRYAAFQQTFHNVFLKQTDFVLLNDRSVNGFKQFIFSAREKILTTLQKNLAAGKDELGIAEALLIGYTNDLDKDLVQAYSNTGVVHVIAISGMHLGLIYVVLVWLFARIPGLKNSKWLQAILILACLWLFSLLTGGSASVIRSAVMFTFITLGKTVFQKQSNIFSSLAASAFVMLCYNPYYLWDVGFQLSYLAVTGIVIFQKPIYNLLYVKNKWVDKVWRLTAISMAAQILTFPVCIYYFHQFPNLFLITNVIAVPLSTIILFAEITLVAFAWVPFVGQYFGKVTGWLVWLMNKIILWINDFSFAVWDKIPSNVFTTWLLYATVIATSVWLLTNHKKVLQMALCCLLGFVMAHTYLAWQIKNQQKLIVYNVPKQQAIDFVSGNNYKFIGDSILLQDGMLQNFHLKPGRIALQLNKKVDTMATCNAVPPFYKFGNKKVFVIDENFTVEPVLKKIDIDVLIISKSPKLYIENVVQIFNCKEIVADASNSLWKIEKWKQDCNQLNLRFHSIPEKGAFVLDL
jgi:competence protein ComEC